MTTLATRTAPSLYSGMILTLIALALALEASFVASLAWPRGSAARILGPAVIDRATPRPSSPASPAASSPAPCAIG